MCCSARRASADIQLVYAHSDTSSDTSEDAQTSALNPKVETPLGEDVLVLKSMSGSEEISRLFQYQLELVSDDPVIDAKRVVGQKLTLTIDLPSGGERHFNGYVSRLVRAETLSRGNKTLYRAEVVPWLWFLTRTADVRIFQNLSVPEIMEQVFNELDIAEFDLRLERDYLAREYIVQYRETDFNFVSRLMEQRGSFTTLSTKRKSTLWSSVIPLLLMNRLQEVKRSPSWVLATRDQRHQGSSRTGRGHWSFDRASGRTRTSTSWSPPRISSRRQRRW